MERAHEGPRTTDKESAPPARRNVPKPAPSGAGGMLDLQRAAGNRAVAKMLTGRTIRHRTPARAPDPASQPAAPVSVQRHALTAAMQGVKPNLQEYDFKLIAQQILTPQSTPTAPTAPISGVPQQPRTLPSTSGQTGATTTGVTPGAAATSLVQPVDWSIPTKADLEAREKRLKGRLSDDEQARMKKKEELDRLEERKKLEDREKELRLGPNSEVASLKRWEEDLGRREELKKLNEREKELKRGPSRDEAALEMKKEEVARLERQRAIEDRSRKLKTAQSPEEQALKAREQELDDLEADQKAEQAKAEETRQTRRKAAKARQSLKRVDWSKVPGNSRF